MAFNYKNISQILFLEDSNFIFWILWVILKTTVFAQLFPQRILNILKFKFVILTKNCLFVKVTHFNSFPKKNF